MGSKKREPVTLSDVFGRTPAQRRFDTAADPGTPDPLRLLTAGHEAALTGDTLDEQCLWCEEPWPCQHFQRTEQAIYDADGNGEAAGILAALIGYAPVTNEWAAAHHPDPDVVAALALNGNTPDDLREAAVYNPVCPDWALVQIVTAAPWPTEPPTWGVAYHAAHRLDYRRHRVGVAAVSRDAAQVKKLASSNDPWVAATAQTRLGLTGPPPAPARKYAAEKAEGRTASDLRAAAQPPQSRGR